MILPGALLLAKKEFLDKVRNKWILSLSILFAVLGVVFAYIGAVQTAGEVGFQEMEVTVISLMGLTALLMPLVGLILAYGTIAGEDENGSLGLLMSLPMTRSDIILGKFLGLSAVMATTVLVGLGAAGLVVVAFAGTGGWEGFLYLMGASILLGVLFIALGIFLSTFMKRRSTAIGGAVFLFLFFFLLYDLIVLSIYAATGGDILGFFLPGADIPEWFFAAMLGNPIEASQAAISLAIGIESIFGYSFGYPAFMTPALIVGVQLLYTFVPLTLTFLRFERRDV